MKSPPSCQILHHPKLQDKGSPTKATFSGLEMPWYQPSRKTISSAWISSLKTNFGLFVIYNRIPYVISEHALLVFHWPDPLWEVLDQNDRSRLLAVVWHGAVLDQTRENNHVAGLGDYSLLVLWNQQMSTTKLEWIYASTMSDFVGNLLR